MAKTTLPPRHGGYKPKSDAQGDTNARRTPPTPPPRPPAGRGAGSPPAAKGDRQ